jgi:RNA polymerase II subunit A small phosphatase-like protein
LTSSRRTTTPSEQTTGSRAQLYEKEKDAQAQGGLSVQETAKSAKRASQSTAPDQSGASDLDSESKHTTLVAPGPSITLNPPVADDQDNEVSREAVSDSKDEDGDLEMPDADSAASQQAQNSVVVDDDSYPKTVPPPPPPPSVPIVNEEATMVEEKAVVAEQPQQKFLLPPIEQRFKGRKCLVLDLDETLVHSSFKVSRLNPHEAQYRNSQIPDITPSRFHDTR